MLRKAGLITNLIFLMSGVALAANTPEGTSKVNYAPESATKAQTSAPALNKDEGPLVFSAPPRESQEAGIQTYAPIAEYLSKATGKKIIYKYPGNWLSYQMDMQKGAYDLVFDGPHLNSWRATKLQHNVLAKLPGEHVFVVIVKKSNNAITDVKQLNGRSVCAMTPPNLGTLTLLNQFDNPARQPAIINTDGWESIYKGLMSDSCVAAVLPLKNLEKYDRGMFTRIVFKAKNLPNQAFSAGRRISSEDQDKIARALLAAEASGPTAKLRETYAVEGGFLPTTKEEYAGLGAWLKDVWGY